MFGSGEVGDGVGWDGMGMGSPFYRENALGFLTTIEEQAFQ